MRPIRLYSSEPLAAHREQALPQEAARHVLRVLRLRAGDPLTLFDGRGGEYAARLAHAGRGTATVEIGEHLEIERESPLSITLLQALARGEKMDWIVQKATELGVAHIVPVTVDRSVVRVADEERADRKLAHWQAVAASACEQCGRNRLPRIAAPTGLMAALALAGNSSVGLLLSPGAPDSLAAAARDGGLAAPVALLVGPEGGLEAHEIASARHHGFREVHLGPRVLRTETAALAAISVLQALAGDGGPATGDSG